MSLTAKQDEWSNLLFTESIERSPLAKDLYEPLHTSDRLDLAAAWLSDGIHARHTDYPRSALEIKFFKISRSAVIRGLFNVAVLFQILFTFLDNTRCDHEYKSVDTTMFHENGVPTRLTITILDLCFLCLYLFDLFLVFAVNPSKKSFTSKPWSTFRLFICLFVLMDCLLYFIDPSQPRLMRCVFPFLLISRRNNLKLMVQGLLVSAYNSLPIIKALVSILVLWGFAGFFFFRATDGSDAFNNPGTGIAEALHCFTSRPYVLKAVDTIYANNQASTVYFITLTLAADILCIALIVAVGAKHYKQFAGSILHQRLVDRRHAVSCAFRAVASCNTTIHDVDEVGVGAQDDEKSITSDAESYKQQQYEEDFNHSGKRELRVSKEDWICMCSHMTGKYAPTPHNAAFIFDLVVDGDPREHIDDSGEVYKKFVLHLDEFLFFRCCALVSTRVVIQVEAPVLLPDSEQSGESDNDSSTTGSGVELPSRLSTMESATYTGENIGLSLPADKNVITLISPTIGAAQKRHSATGSDIDQQSSTQERTSSHGSAKTSQERLSSLQNPSNYKVAMLAVDADVGPRERRSSLKVLRVSERSPAELRQSPTLSLLARPSRQIAGASYFEAQFHCVLDFLYYYLQPLRDVCVHITGANVTVGGDTGGIRQKYTINLFYAVNIFLLLLLLLDLSFLSQPRREASWFQFACALEAFFWCHLFVRIIAVGLRRFVSFYENRGDTLLSILSLIAIIKLGEEYFSNTYDFHTSYAMGWYLLIQCGRLFKLFFAFNDVKIFEHMRPVLIRASFIYFSIIYFFAIFGYSYFCDALDVEDAKNTTQGNDANQWPQYSHILNFKTLLQSMFTLFQISILGNWSIVMDAAVASTTKPAAAYIYFYSYRLLITLFILPILLSFIIQVFLSALAAREKEVQDEEALEEAEKQAQRASEFLDPPSASRFSLGDMGIYTSNPFLQRPSSGGIPSVSTRVSYNVNQEVLLLGRQSAGGGRNDDNDDDDDEDGDGGRGGNDDRGDGGRENTAADECDTDESETLSPLASDLHHPHSQHQRQSNYGPNSPGRQSGSLNPDKQARKQWRPHFSVKLGVDKQAATNARDKNSESIPHISSKVVTTGTSSGGVASPVAGEKGKGGGGGSAGSSVGGSGMRGSDLSSVRSGQSVDHLRSTEGSSSSSTSLSPSTHRSSSMQHAVLTSAAATPNSSRAGSADQKAKVTVQYDSKAGSSMMSIWTIGESTSAKSASSKKSGKGVSVSGKGVTSSPAEQDQVAELQAQLQAALRALDAERAKTKALAEPVNLM